MIYTNEPSVIDSTRLQSDYDLNNVNVSGWYTATAPKNGVSGLTTEKLFVIAPKDKQHVTQFAFGDEDHLEQMWFRSYANNTWSVWKEVATTDLYLALTGGTITGDLKVNGHIDGKFAGTPEAPDADDKSKDSQIANIKYVKQQIANLVNYAPSALDTLKELADAIGNDPNFAATMIAKLAEKYDNTGGQITGDVNVTGMITGNLTGTASFSSQTAGYHLLQRNTAYVVGDVVYSPKLASNLRLHCTVAGTTAHIEPVLVSIPALTETTLTTEPDSLWKGGVRTIDETDTLKTTQDNAGNLTVSGLGEFTSDGFFTLESTEITPTTEITGIALMAAGCWAGTWTTYEGEAE